MLLLVLLPNGVGIKYKCKNQKPNENEVLKFGGKNYIFFINFFMRTFDRWEVSRKTYKTERPL